MRDIRKEQRFAIFDLNIWLEILITSTIKRPTRTVIGTIFDTNAITVADNRIARSCVIARYYNIIPVKCKSLHDVYM